MRCSLLDHWPRSTECLVLTFTTVLHAVSLGFYLLKPNSFWVTETAPLGIKCIPQD
jgi:hypothetical protein